MDAGYLKILDSRLRGSDGLKVARGWRVKVCTPSETCP